MIDKTFAFILDELNGFLNSRYPGNEPHAVLSALVNQDGTVPVAVENKLVLSMVNVEREAAAPASALQARSTGGYARGNPTLSINVYLLVAASFGNNYREALKFLSAALAFFQSHPLYNANNSAGRLPKELDKLSFEMVSLDMHALNNLWSILGGKYLPSALYKARILTVQDGRITELVPASTGSGARL
jgi:hypothetical protein